PPSCRATNIARPPAPPLPPTPQPPPGSISPPRVKFGAFGERVARVRPVSPSCSQASPALIGLGLVAAAASSSSAPKCPSSGRRTSKHLILARVFHFGHRVTTRIQR